MKTKKTTIFSLTAAVLHVTATTAAFATSASAGDAKLDNSVTFEDTVVTCYTGEEGKTYNVLYDRRILKKTEYEKENLSPVIEW